MPQDWQITDTPQPPKFPAQGTTGWQISDSPNPPVQQYQDGLGAGLSPKAGTTIGPRENTPLTDWLEELKGDIMHGTTTTGPGRALKFLGAGGLEKGVSPTVANVMGGELIGPAKMAHATMSQPTEQYVKEHPNDPNLSPFSDRSLHNFNEFASGLFQSPGPGAALIPGAVPGMAMYGPAGAAIGKGAQLFGANPEQQEAIQNASMMLAPLIHAGVNYTAPKIGQYIKNRAPTFGKAMGYGMAAVNTIRTGNPTNILYASRPATRMGTAAVRGVGNTINTVGSVPQPLFDTSAITPSGEVIPTSSQENASFGRRVLGMRTGTAVPPVIPERPLLPRGAVPLGGPTEPSSAYRPYGPQPPEGTPPGPPSTQGPNKPLVNTGIVRDGAATDIGISQGGTIRDKEGNIIDQPLANTGISQFEAAPLTNESNKPIINTGENAMLPEKTEDKEAQFAARQDLERGGELIRTQRGKKSSELGERYFTPPWWKEDEEPPEGASALHNIPPDQQHYFNPYTGKEEPDKGSAGELNDLYAKDVIEGMERTHGELIETPKNEPPARKPQSYYDKQNEQIDEAAQWMLDNGYGRQELPESVESGEDFLNHAKELGWVPRGEENLDEPLSEELPQQWMDLPPHVRKAVEDAGNWLMENHPDKFTENDLNNLLNSDPQHIVELARDRGWDGGWSKERESNAVGAYEKGSDEATRLDATNWLLDHGFTAEDLFEIYSNDKEGFLDFARSHGWKPEGEEPQQLIKPPDEGPRPGDRRWEVFDPRDGKTIASYDNEEDAKRHAESSSTLDYGPAFEGPEEGIDSHPTDAIDRLDSAAKWLVDHGYDKDAVDITYDNDPDELLAHAKRLGWNDITEPSPKKDIDSHLTDVTDATKFLKDRGYNENQLEDMRADQILETAKSHGWNNEPPQGVSPQAFDAYKFLKYNDLISPEGYKNEKDMMDHASQNGWLPKNEPGKLQPGGEIRQRLQDGVAARKWLESQGVPFSSLAKFEARDLIDMAKGMGWNPDLEKLDKLFEEPKQLIKPPMTTAKMNEALKAGQWLMDQFPEEFTRNDLIHLNSDVIINEAKRRGFQTIKDPIDDAWSFLRTIPGETSKLSGSSDQKVLNRARELGWVPSEEMPDTLIKPPRTAEQSREAIRQDLIDTKDIQHWMREQAEKPGQGAPWGGEFDEPRGEASHNIPPDQQHLFRFGKKKSQEGPERIDESKTEEQPKPETSQDLIKVPGELQKSSVDREDLQHEKGIQDWARQDLIKGGRGEVENRPPWWEENKEASHTVGLDLAEFALNIPNKIAGLQKQFGISKEIATHVMDADPTENKTYAKWIALNAKRNNLRLPEDNEKLTTALNKFEQLKASPNFTGERDIQKYDPAALFRLTREEDSISNKQRVKNLIEKGGPGAQLVAHRPDSNLKLFKVTDPKPAITLSSNTSWCTNLEEGAVAERYLKKGPLWIIYKGDKPIAQMHGITKQFMDVDDRPVDFTNPDIKEAVDMLPSSVVSKKTLQDKVKLADPKISPQEFTSIVGKSKQLIHWALSNIRNIPPEVLDSIYDKSNTDSKIALGYQKGIGEDLKYKLASDLNPRVRSVMAWKVNSNDFDLVQQLSKDSKFSVRVALASNKKVDISWIRHLVNDSTMSVKAAIAKREDLPVEDLIKLSKENNPNVRRAISYNENTPPDILKRIFEESLDPMIAGSVVYNPSAPESVLRAAYNDGTFHWALSRNPSTPVDILVDMLNNITPGNRDLTTSVLRNPSIPMEYIDWATRNTNQSYREAAASNESNSAENFELLSKDPETWVRHQLVYNEKVPRNIIERMSTDDPNGTIRAIAIRRLGGGLHPLPPPQELEPNAEAHHNIGPNLAEFRNPFGGENEPDADFSEEELNRMYGQDFPSGPKITKVHEPEFIGKHYSSDEEQKMPPVQKIREGWIKEANARGEQPPENSYTDLEFADSIGSIDSDTGEVQRYAAHLGVDPMEIEGHDERVTDEKTITILFDYPIERAPEIEFYNPHGFTKGDLYKAISDGYEKIYDEEGEEEEGPRTIMFNRGSSKNPKYGIWGHGIDDLVIEGVEQVTNGKFVLHMGS